MHWSSLVLRVLTTGVLAAACVLVTAWGPLFVWETIPRTKHPEVRCGSVYRFNQSGSIVDDFYRFTGPRFANSTRPIPRDDWSPDTVRATLPDRYTRYIQDEFGWECGWPERVYFAGWPFRCASLAFEPQGRDTAGHMHGRRPINAIYSSQKHAVPGVHALPFVVNMVILAIPIELMWFGLGQLRHRQRKREGCCVRCSYSLVGLASPVCPECGEKIVRDAGESAEGGPAPPR